LMVWAISTHSRVQAPGSGTGLAVGAGVFSERHKCIYDVEEFPIGDLGCGRSSGSGGWGRLLG